MPNLVKTKVINKSAFAQIAEVFVNRNPFVLNGRLIYPNNNKIGRPSVMTPEVVRKLEYSFAYDCSVEEACVYAGIARNTYYEFCKQYPEFQDRISELRCISIMVVRVTLVNAAMEDPNLALKYLERKCPQEFSLRIRNEMVVKNETNNGHQISGEQETLIKQAFGNFMKTEDSDEFDGEDED